ncbi:tryptophan-rich sensory protein [Dyadobacter tibetensis]|uniref:tryptophan-rich sensory protein n=1 Tax=Dyadobacter tibetensis TaxID=1211851 RepID=UPI0004709005|nr:tryptophan-rich sensory protein [Dyadobacter tibetensis]
MLQSRNSRYLTATIVLGGILASFWGSRKGGSNQNNRTVKKRQNKLDRNLLTPANATFGIAWGVIYSGTAALIFHQASSRQLSNPRYARAQNWLRANYILGALFGYFFSRSDRTGRVGAALTTMSMLPAALGLHRALAIGQFTPPQPERTLQKSVSLYTGWLGAASAISLINLLQEAGYFTKKKAAVRISQYAIPTLATGAIAASRSLRDPYLLIPIAGALLGIAAKQQHSNKSVAQLSLTIAGTILADLLNNLGTNGKVIPVKAPST